jgi:3-oxoacyl-[acyl-carrier-protein] synthase-3
VRTSTGARYARILALGEYRPATVVTNDDLAARVDTNDQWVRDRVGVVTRRVARADESVVDMAAAAGAKAIAAGGLQPGDIDLVIVATCSMPSQLPSAAAEVGSRLGIRAPGAFDVNAACAGFVYAVSTAASAVVSGTARHVLVVGAEKLSDWIDWDDRSTCIIFGDGAGAAVVGPSDTPAIGPVAWGSAGDMADAIVIPDRASLLQQDGQAVFRWATTAMVPVAREACELAGVDLAELGAFVPHQANLRIIEAIARRLGVDSAVVARDLVESGNTSSASIPLALCRMMERGEVASGAPVLILGFGSGLTYAGQVVLCP